MSDTLPDVPRFGPWMTATRPRDQARSFKIGGKGKALPASRPSDRPSWKDVMQKAPWMSKPESSRGISIFHHRLEAVGGDLRLTSR